MDEIEKCPKCGGEMREGELIVKTTESPSKTDPFRAMMTRTNDIASTLGIFQEESIVIEGPLWQEQTDKEGGWLLKPRKEIKVFPLRGKRCMNCGYIELYIKEG